MFTLKLTEDQSSFLAEALNKAMDWESDNEYYEAYNDLRTLARKSKKLTLTEDQLAFFSAALDKASDNEPDGEYYDAFAELRGLLRETANA